MWSWRRWAVGIVCVVLLAVAVHVEGPMLTESIRSFGHLRWRFVVWAVLLQTMSMFALALMERRILTLADLLRADAPRAARPQARPRGQPRRDWRAA